MPEPLPESGRDLNTALANDGGVLDQLHAGPATMMAAVEAGPETVSRFKAQGHRHRRLALDRVAGAHGLHCDRGAVGSPAIPDPRADVGDLRLGWFAPGHVFGTDTTGSDVFSLIVNGARNSLTIGVFSVLIGFIIGGMLGLIAGYFEGRTGAVLAPPIDILLAYPALVLAISIVTFLGQLRTLGHRSPWPSSSIPVLASDHASLDLDAGPSVSSSLAARAQGAKHRRIMIREVLPNVLPAMLSIALLGVAIAIVAEAGLASSAPA